MKRQSISQSQYSSVDSELKRQQQPVFNRSDRFIQGWYWAMPCRDLKPGQSQSISLMGKELVLYRTRARDVIALDRYCPHMGAALDQGKIEGTTIRCPLHYWRFDHRGHCVEIPALGQHHNVIANTQLHVWPTAEHYGMIWIWTGDTPTHPPPYIPELEGVSCDAALSYRFERNCHPNVLMINAIDAHHFNSVHNLPLEVRFKARAINDNALCLDNTTRGGEASKFVKLIRPLYKNEVTYKMCYWYGSTGTVTVGPDFFHFHIMFALRPIARGKTEGWTILITPKRLAGRLINPVVLWITQQVAAYFATGDIQVFQGIRFDFKTPLEADQSIIQFAHHVNRQKALNWGDWSSVT
ncbi:ring-hydroxylating large terminal subunit [Leptolyngbya sp. Heron Island J]|uniref:aromatic ring-hydroxylating dioxygenase subunit alpha n=1 Tax=Leptolyngbya sp. Heron Island J TaxID=1385935 RepID=UPI0003B93D41|nr:aromatic ring-hydroxylating dioxygenase subunit alpha [Leptolyngbya sp. Heron Island J]ESA35269.1 ring-hydroxylating large terminal subunit [Leptolyngbya sp. Heron Island J]